MDDAVESFEYKGYTIDILRDDSPESPREWDNLGIMTCFHSRYNLGDKHNYKSPSDFIYELADEYFNEDKVNQDYDDMLDASFIEKYLKKLDRHIIILPLYLYDHSGITMKTSPFGCQWDSGQVGWTYIRRARVRKDWKVLRISPKLKMQTLNILEGEVETYDQFLTGEVYGFEIYSPDDDSESVDSYWGYFGDPDGYVLQAAKELIDSYPESSLEMRAIK